VSRLNIVILAHGVVAVVQLPLGVHPIVLVVDDGLQQPPTPSRSRSSPRPGRATPDRPGAIRVAAFPALVASLSAALRSIERGNRVSAINQLGGFQNKVRAQVAPSDPALAACLIQRPRKSLTPERRQHPSEGRLRGRLKATRHPAAAMCNCSSRLSAGRCAFWSLDQPGALEMIGVATDKGDGTFSFKDPNDAKFPSRFYRIFAP